MKHIILVVFLSAFTLSICANEQVDTVLTKRLNNLDVVEHKNQFGVHSSQMSAIKLGLEDFKSTPTVLGEVDVLKTLHTLAGVSQGDDGKVAMFVRGGNSDHNLITIDGLTIINSEHLGGFLSAINPDMVESVDFYTGAFPARYGQRLSSVVDAKIKDGDHQKYHGSFTVGMLSAKAQIEGPIFKGKTSFNIGGRMSFYEAIMKPLFRKIAEEEEMKEYNKMDFYDITAKISHKFSVSDKLSATFYYGNDVFDSQPSSSNVGSKSEKILEIFKDAIYYKPTRIEKSIDKNESTDNNWKQIMGGVEWDHRFSDGLSLQIAPKFSLYDYNLEMKSYELAIDDNLSGDLFQSINEVDFKKLVNSRHYYNKKQTGIIYNSNFNSYSITADMNYISKDKRHDAYFGINGEYNIISPIVNVERNDSSFFDYADDLFPPEIRTLILKHTCGRQQNLTNISVYAQDDWSITPTFKANIGLRYNFYNVENKFYHFIEPRISLRYMFANNKFAVKASWARTSQAVQLLQSSNLVKPSSLWIAATDKLKPMLSDIYATGINCDLFPGYNLIIEGYYKTMNNLVEYRDGASFTNPFFINKDLEDMVIQGKGRSYGIETTLWKTKGAFIGRVSYTWSKSLRRFDQLNASLDAGREFYALNDRRHNLKIVAEYKFNKHWSISASWSYMSGRRGNLNTTTFVGGMQSEYDAFGTAFDNKYFDQMPPLLPNPYDIGGESFTSDSSVFFRYIRYTTAMKRNGFQLPPIHNLDLSFNYEVRSRRCIHNINLSIYNIYNRQNISRIYLGYTDDLKPVLKGICNLPCLPSLSYSLKF